jgi:predicted enzyme related to lactoylglutathione lyase
MKWIVGIIAAFALAIMSPAIAADASGYGMPIVKIAVKDYQKAIGFYTKLGLKVGQKYNPAEQELKWDSPSQGSSLVLVHDEKGQMKPIGPASLLISVPDLKATVKALKDAGFANIGEPRVTPRAMVLVVDDPDGNHVELVSAPK